MNVKFNLFLETENVLEDGSDRRFFLSPMRLCTYKVIESQPNRHDTHDNYPAEKSAREREGHLRSPFTAIPPLNQRESEY